MAPLKKHLSAAVQKRKEAELAHLHAVRHAAAIRAGREQTATAARNAATMPGQATTPPQPGG